jgi:hypothetical protein
MLQYMTSSAPAQQVPPQPKKEPKRYIGSGEDAYTEEELNDLILRHMYAEEEEDVHCH